MGRLKGFDYKSPYFYIVTLKRLPDLAAFSQIGPAGLIENYITRAFNATIMGFHLKWRCCEEISPFIVMPDHLHLMIKIRDTPDRVALGVLVSQLSKELRSAYWRVVAPDGATGRTPIAHQTPANGATTIANSAKGFANGATTIANGALGFAGGNGAQGFAGGASAGNGSPMAIARFSICQS